MIEINGDTLTLHFDRFDLESYKLFLKAKRLPEYQVRFYPEGETYSITTHARFAPLLDVELPGSGATDLPLSDYLFDDQAAVVRMALDAKRFAAWLDCGLGKTPIAYEWAKHVTHRTGGGRVLIITMNEIVNQFLEENKKFYGDTLPITKLGSRQAMRDWMKNGPGTLAITNYEKWNPEDLASQVVSEARHLSGIVLDESHRLRTGGGKQKWAIIKSCRSIEYKLSCTATPAPNDYMEYASQGAFLEKLRSEGEILWTYFTRDPKTHRWMVKPHARKAFFQFMSSWSIYVRDPKRYGWRLDHKEVPKPTVIVHEIEPTAQQLRAKMTLAASAASGQMSFLEDDTNAIQRNKLSQIAKGFRYTKGEAAGKYELVESRKPAFVAELVRQEVAAGHQVLVWTVYDAESRILSDLLRGVDFSMLTGRTAEVDRLAILENFRTGNLSVLVSRASMLGHGMNFQNCGSMIFSGWNDSYVNFYQAVRRAYRHGQTKSVRVHMPIIKELEGDTWDNICRKEGDHESGIREMEQNYLEARKALKVSI